ncbi:MAG: hypothetical protein LBV34_26895 [Nocardiopsaceae bacterium]|jgi:hypothetical protein|nr:hypothetical protein [Nocardiopsaceae bacterium]
MSAVPAEVEPGTPGGVYGPGAVYGGAIRLVRLYLASRRAAFALAAVIALAGGLRFAMIWHWDSYGALQLPLVFETGCATVIAATSASAFGEQERAAGSWLPALRFGATLGLTVVALAALATAGLGTHMAGGMSGEVRNLAGAVGLGLLSAAACGGGLAWIGPAGYLVVAAYALYGLWHGGGPSTPWMWPARPQADLGAWLCAAVVFAAGMTVITVRGARNSA